MENLNNIVQDIYAGLRNKSSESLGANLFHIFEKLKTEKLHITKTPVLITIGKKLGGFLISDPNKFRYLEDLWSLSSSENHSLPQGLITGRENRLITIGALSVLSKNHYEECKNFVFNILDTINDWETCDQLALRVIVNLAVQDPNDTFSLLNEWVRSENKWVRRLAVATIPPFIRAKKTESELCLRFLDNTMTETDRDVIKAIGWALREISKKDPVSVYFFLKKWVDVDNQNTRRIIREGMKKLPPEKQDELNTILSK